MLQILFDENHNPIMPKILLANKSGKCYGALTNVYALNVIDAFSDTPSFSCKIAKTNNGKTCKIWDKITDFRLAYCVEWDAWFEITVELDDGQDVVKSIEANGLCQAELSQINLYEFQVNTEDDIARDDYVLPTVFYDEDAPENSLLNRMLEKAPHYSIGFVDYSLRGIQRTFEFDGTSIKDGLDEVAEEIGCIFVYENENDMTKSFHSNPLRRISAYDLKNVCNECGTRFDAEEVCPECGSSDYKVGYGEDTTIFVSKDNLTDNVIFSTDVESVKNNLRMVAGDDLMTATIKNCNPNGSQYIWYISEEMKKDMPTELVDKINEYDETYAFYDKENIITLDSKLVTEYNGLVTKYRQYDKDIPMAKETLVGYVELMETIYDAIDFNIYLSDALMPSQKQDETNARLEAAKLVSANLSPIAVANIEVASKATVDNYVLEMARILVDHRYTVKIKTSTFDEDNLTWRGNFTVSNYSDDDDKADSVTSSVVVNGDYIKYLQQKIDKIIARADDNDAGVAFVMKQELIYSGGSYSGAFVAELRKYSLNVLNIIKDCCQSCLDILIEQGAGNKASEISASLYEQFYEKYYRKMQAIEEEMSLRQDEIDVIQNMLESAYDERINVQKILNFEEYLGEDLWKVFVSYRRDDVYENNNFISDGLSNAELFENANEFIRNAQKEIVRSATAQHKITSTLNNLLAIKEFEKLLGKFKVGNWLRVEVDGNVYKLRLLSFEVDFDNFENINVEFSDVEKYRNGTSDVASVLSKASSMASSFPYVARQSSKGKDAFNKVDGWSTEGFDLTATKIVNDAYNQDHVWNEHGFLFRKFDSITGGYEPIQLKLINSTLAITDNDWETTKAAVGNFLFKNPQTGKVESAFGVNAETIVGTVILGEKLGIYNSAGTMSFDTRGFSVKNDSNEVLINPNADSIFTIKNGDTNVLAFDNQGNGTFTGKIVATSLQLRPNVTIPQSGVNGLTDELQRLDTIAKEAKSFEIQLSNEYQAISADSTGKIGTFPSGVTTTAKAMYGNIDVTNLAAWGASSSEGISGIWNSNTHEFIVKSMSEDVDNGFVDITCVYNDNDKTLTLTKRFTLAKVKSANGISKVENFYLISASASGIEVSGNSWNTKPDNTTKDLPYLWNYEKVTYTDGTSKDTTPVVISKYTEDGRGIKSITEYYKRSSNGTSAPTGTWATTPPSVTATEKYLWNYEVVEYTDDSTPHTSEKRVIGVYGDKGDKGDSTYTWVKYADDANGTNMSDSPTDKEYIGLAYNKSTATASTTASDYTWKKFVGEDGDSSYTWVKYADDANGKNMTDSYVGKKFIGLAFGKSTATESANPSDYTWSKYIGDDAVTWEINLSDLLVVQDAANKVYPNNISVSFYQIVSGTRTAYQGKLRYEFLRDTDDGSGLKTWQMFEVVGKTSSVNVDINVGYKIYSIIFKLYTPDGSTLLDSQTVSVNHQLVSNEVYESSKVDVVETTNSDGQTVRRVTVGGETSNYFDVIESDEYIFASIPIGDKEATGAANAHDRGNGYFKISKEGLLEANNALIYGTIYATTGEFTGIVHANGGSFDNITGTNIAISGNSSFGGANGVTIKNGKVVFGSDVDLSFIDGSTYLTADKLKTDSLEANNLTIGGNSTFGGSLSAASGTFAGNLVAAGGTFSGTLSAASGTFAGTLTSGNISSTGLSVLATSTRRKTELTADNTGFEINVTRIDGTKMESHAYFRDTIILKTVDDEGDSAELSLDTGINGLTFTPSSSSLYAYRVLHYGNALPTSTYLNIINDNTIEYARSTGAFGLRYERTNSNNIGFYIQDTSTTNRKAYLWHYNTSGFSTAKSLISIDKDGVIEVGSSSDASTIKIAGKTLAEIGGSGGGGSSITIDTTVKSGSGNAVSGGAVYTALSNKQDKVSGTILTSNNYSSYLTISGVSYAQYSSYKLALEAGANNCGLKYYGTYNGWAILVANVNQGGALTAGAVCYATNGSFAKIGGNGQLASDERVKKNIKELSSGDAYNLLKHQKLVTFNYTETPNIDRVGVTAQSLQRTLNTYGIKNYDFTSGVKYDEANDLLSETYDIKDFDPSYRYNVSYVSFIPILWKGWQMHDEKIEDYSSSISRVESENAKLKNEIELLQSQNKQLQMAIDQIFIKLAELEKKVG